MTFRLDGLGLLFALLITGIGTAVCFYARGYLDGDRRLGRFYAFLYFFMASMLGLVLADNFILFFVFWELTGISSYFLIGFDHEKESSRTSALQALLVTGGGGLAMLAGLLCVSMITGASRFSELDSLGFSAASLVPPGVLALVLAGAFTKSAQFPFHFWLPNAMTAPAPVSAYLHSSTMVKAGIYLMLRLSPSFSGDSFWRFSLTAIGAATVATGAVLAVKQTDMKRSLAYLTVSALGMMTMMIGAGAEGAIHAAVAFLVAHAFYKASLFMCAGSVDHATHERNPEALTGLARFMPFTAVAAVLAGAAMASLPLFLSFPAKEAVLEAGLHSPAPWIAGIAAGAGAVYAAMAWLLGVKPFGGAVESAKTHGHEVSFPMYVPPLALAACGLVFGVFPDLVAPFVDGAVRSAGGSPGKLVAWHGFTPALFLSLGGLVVGAVLYRGRFAARKALAPLDLPGWPGPERLYRTVLEATVAGAGRLTRTLQNGYLRRYLRVTFASVSALLAVALFRSGNLPSPAPDTARAYEIVLSFFICAAALAAVLARSRFVVVAMLGSVGMSITLLFVLYGAPDLAMTQFTVETLTVILLALVMHRLPPFAPAYSSVPQRAIDLLLAGGFGFLMSVLTWISFTDARPQLSAVSAFFSENSLPAAHGRNIVNVILVDFRGLDTLGEITVLAVAGVGVFSLVKAAASRGSSR